MTVQERIRAIRKSKGLTQKQLADRLGLAQASVGQYELNPEPPKILTIKKIANALGVPYQEILGYHDLGNGKWGLSLEQHFTEQEARGDTQIDELITRIGRRCGNLSYIGLKLLDELAAYLENKAFYRLDRAEDGVNAATDADGEEE